jgi:hypothetical protein
MKIASFRFKDVASIWIILFKKIISFYYSVAV